MKDLLNKYNVPAPRYTSYPTVPYWSVSPTEEQWLQSLNKGLEDKESSWSLYIHIPFCEMLCTFCGCNTVVTRNHNKEEGYIKLLLSEWNLYKKNIDLLTKRSLKQIHLGGGTPTFLSAQNLEELLQTILNDCSLNKEDFSASIEVDPRVTNKKQLQKLFNMGFQRISLGVQDFNEDVQRLVNRIQPYETVKNITELSREIGYSSVNFDLIYGLPRQKIDLFKNTIEKTIELRPDRIALYSLAKVPWIKPAQRLFKDEDLPEGDEKRELYELGRSSFLENGYIEIGMDHFALETDSLAHAQKDLRLHRNFMGYTDQKTNVMLGLGVSSISESPTCFYQNDKVLNIYERKISKGEFSGLRGHVLSAQDQERKKQILQFMTQFEVDLESLEQEEFVKNFVAPLIADELVEVSNQKMKMTQKGIPFLRLACMALDERLQKNKLSTKTFSQVI